MSLAPPYSSIPGPDESRLDMAARSAVSLASPFGTLIKRARGIGIALYNQQGDVSFATYGRGATVRGEVSLEGVHGITSVEVTVSAHTVEDPIRLTSAAS